MSTPTNRQLRARHARRLATMKAQLTEMSLEWDDRDQYFVNMLQEAADRLEDLKVEMQEASSDA